MTISDTPGEGLDPKPVAFMVSDPMIPHQPVKARGWSNEPFPAFYPAAREADALEAARILRADCVPLYAAPLPIASDTAGLPSDCAGLVDAAKALLEQWRYYRDDTTLNQADAYYALAKGQWDKWNALAEAMAALSEQGEAAQPAADGWRKELQTLEATVKLEAVGGGKSKYAEGRRHLAVKLLPIVDRLLNAASPPADTSVVQSMRSLLDKYADDLPETSNAKRGAIREAAAFAERAMNASSPGIASQAEEGGK